MAYYDYMRCYWVAVARAQLGQTEKPRQKLDFKKSLNRRIILMPVTVWHILNMEMQPPETEILRIYRKFHSLKKLVKSHQEKLFLEDFCSLKLLCCVEWAERVLLLWWARAPRKKAGTSSEAFVRVRRRDPQRAKKVDIFQKEINENFHNFFRIFDCCSDIDSW